MTRRVLDQETVNYGGRLSDARALAQFTQTQLAEALGLSRSSVSNIEAGRQRSPAQQVAMTAGVLGVDLTWLLTGEGEPGGLTGRPDELRAYIPEEPPPYSVVQAGRARGNSVWQRGDDKHDARWFPALYRRDTAGSGVLEPLPWPYLVATYSSVTVVRWGTGEEPT